MPSYTFAFYQFANITTNSGDPKNTTITTGTTGSFTVNGGASPISITVNDDDSNFDDAYIDTGTSQLLAGPVTVNGTNYPAGSVVELEFAVSTTSGATFYYIRIGGVNVGIGGPTLPASGTLYTISGSADAQSQPFSSLACFARGTGIDTARGRVPVEALAEGDLVQTLDGALRPLRWIGQRRLGPGDLRRSPHFAPIRFETGAIGNRRPLRVSPQHRMLLTGWRAELHFGAGSVLVPAQAMVNDASIRQEHGCDRVDYFHLLFDRHEVIFAEGAASESFHPGQTGLDGFSVAARAELAQLFPELLVDNGLTACRALTVREARAMARSGHAC
jgi:hypothetical protein